MEILAIGDIFGRVGRRMIKNYLSEIKKKHQIDLVIANVENTTRGRGISIEHYHNLKEYGIDIMTSGNHIFDQKETLGLITEVSDLLRPLNSNPYHPGQGSVLINLKGKRVRITNLIGQTFMPAADSPYFALEQLLKKKDCDIHLLDFHAEATAEKIMFAYHFDGIITAFIGTHTHVQTAVVEEFEKGTVAIIDVGMTGPSGGIIGAEPAGIIQRSKYGYSSPMRPHQGRGQFNGIVLEIDEETNKVIHSERINFKSD